MHTSMESFEKADRYAEAVSARVEVAIAGTTSSFRQPLTVSALERISHKLSVSPLSWFPRWADR